MLKVLKNIKLTNLISKTTKNKFVRLFNTNKFKFHKNKFDVKKILDINLFGMASCMGLSIVSYSLALAYSAFNGQYISENKIGMEISGIIFFSFLVWPLLPVNLLAYFIYKNKN